MPIVSGPPTIHHHEEPGSIFLVTSSSESVSAMNKKFVSISNTSLLVKIRSNCASLVCPNKYFYACYPSHTLKISLTACIPPCCLCNWDLRFIELLELFKESFSAKLLSSQLAPSTYWCMGLFLPMCRAFISLCWTAWGSSLQISPASQSPFE